MAAWRPRISKNGDLPKISYIIRKPEPLGTEFKTFYFLETGVMTRMGIQQGLLFFSVPIKLLFPISLILFISSQEKKE